MSTRSKDRAGLCAFTFADGRRCRTPRQSGHPQFCYFHARKQAQAQAADDLGNDFSYLFSNEYLSACDLSAALGRLFPAVAQGQIKPRTAGTLAYLAQTLLQAIHMAQHEYINAFGADSWRQAVRTSVDSNSDYFAGDSDQAADPDAEEDAGQDSVHDSQPGTEADSEPGAA